MSTKYFGLLGLLLILNPVSIFILLILTVLVNGYRLIVIILAKWLRPDQGVCMSNVTNLLVTDWFSKNPPRSTIVVKVYYKDVRTRKWAEEQALRRWITAKRENNGEPLYPQFSQYPYRWLGFTFWKNDENFDIRNHVFGHSISEKGDDDLNKLTEKLVNERYPKKRSPWEIHILENYKSTKFHEKVSSVFVLKFHHCLADGYSILSALMEGFNETPMVGLVLPKRRQAEIQTLAEKVSFVLTYPFLVCYELFGMYKYALEYSPFKVQDSDKKWHMICSQSELIPIQNVKDIKNKFGVSFTSVLISVISAGITKINSRDIKVGESMKTLCLSTLPLGIDNRQDRLTNQLTGAVFLLPTENSYKSSFDRLKTCNELLEKTRKSLVPSAVRMYTSVLGSLFTKAASLLGTNRFISVALTNFPTLPPNRKGTKSEDAVFAEFTAGGLAGVCGLIFIVASCPPYIRIGVNAEQAVLSQKEADYLVKAMEDEINILYSVTCDPDKIIVN